jgi:general secretion pathway protein A
MYKKFFGLAEAPFNITPDSRFLFLSQRHREALSALVYGIKERKGFILLTGEIGSGKTTICRALVNELRAENIKLALILNPGLSEIELLKTINDEFQIPSFYDTKKGLVDALNQYLIHENRMGNNVCIIIDEAQNLQPELLEQIRLLSNLETESDKLVQMVLIGQPELNETMRLSQLEQLNQRIAVRYHITPLTPEEMLAYIKHRLLIARAKVDVEFTEGALRLAYGVTRGVPRKINVLCDRALLACYVEGTYTADEKIMQKAVEEVGGETGAAGQKQKKKLGLGGTLSRMLTRRAAIAVATAVAVFVLVAGAVAVGMQLANTQQRATSILKPALVEAKENTEREMPDGLRGHDETTTEASMAEATPTPAPTPPPDWEQVRRKLPNWQYEKNSPLVRVNEPRAVLRAAQLSMLKMWGVSVNLAEMAKLGEDLLIDGQLKSESLPIYEVPMGRDYYKAVRLNVPMIVRTKTKTPDQSQYVLLLRAEGEAVTVGDPVWGIKTYKAKEFMTRWENANAILVDVNQLGSLQRGDRNERVRALQRFLKDNKYLDEVSGVYDVKTTEAIRKLQAYYKLDQTGQLDPTTLLVLNSRMTREGPRLSARGD